MSDSDPTDFKIIDNKAFLKINRHGGTISSNSGPESNIIGSTMNDIFKSYIYTLDDVIEKRDMELDATHVRRNLKALSEAVRSKHHLRDFFVREQTQKIKYMFYYVDNNEKVQHAGNGLFETNPNPGMKSKTTVTTEPHGNEIIIEYSMPNRSRHNLVYDDCGKVSVTIKYNNEEIFKSCPYINTAYKNRYGILQNKGLGESDLREQMEKEKFFMIREEDIAKVDTQYSNFSTANIRKKPYYKSTITNNYNYLIEPYTESGQAKQANINKFIGILLEGKPNDKRKKYMEQTIRNKINTLLLSEYNVQDYKVFSMKLKQKILELGNTNDIVINAMKANLDTSLIGGTRRSNKRRVSKRKRRKSYNKKQKNQKRSYKRKQRR